MERPGSRQDPAKGFAGPILGGVVLVAMAASTMAFVPLVECPRCRAYRESVFGRIDGGPDRIEDLVNCRLCSNRERVSLPKKWKWKPGQGRP
jgi:hypothetical protein